MVFYLWLISIYDNYLYYNKVIISQKLVWGITPGYYMVYIKNSPINSYLSCVTLNNFNG